MYSGLPYFIVMYSGMVFGVVFSLSSSHWLSMWAGLEINLICFVPLLVSKATTGEAESAVKYFIFQSLGSCFLVFGSLCSYSLSNSWEVETTCWWGASVVLMGLLLKLGAAPFHWWFPSVLAGLSWPMCLVLVTWQKVGPLALICSLNLGGAASIMVMSSLMSSGVGGLGGLNQTQVRGLLAYSSIGHLSWLLFASLTSASLVFSYFVMYVAVSFFTFVAFWQLASGRIVDMSGSFEGPKLAVAVVSLFSLAGLPPLLGFIPKWLVFMAAATSSPLWWVLVVLIMCSLLSLYYYLSLSMSGLLSAKKTSMKGRGEWSMFLITALVVQVGGGFLLLLV